MKGLKNNKKQWNDDLSLVKWDKFEAIIANHYKMQGYRVEHVGTGRSGNTDSKFDGGIDLKMHKDGKYTIVQCKHWNAKQVPHNDVHELIGLIVTESADAGIFVTSGEYTSAALQAAAKHGRIELVDGTSLRQRLGIDTSTISKSHYSEHASWREEVESSKQNDSKQWETETSNRSWKRNRNRKPTLTMEQFVVNAALALIFLFVVFKMIPSFIVGAVKRPVSPVIQSQVISTPTQVKPEVSAIKPVPRSTVHWYRDPRQSMTQSPKANQENGRAAPSNNAIAPIDMKEWERRNKESMKVLESTTPELKD